jgi:hypothetical protein
LTLVVGICTNAAEIKETGGFLAFDPLGVILETDEITDLIAAPSEGLLGFVIEEGLSSTYPSWHHDLINDVWLLYRLRT